jgi:hypothetical protein
MFNSLCNVVDYFTILGDMAPKHKSGCAKKNKRKGDLTLVESQKGALKRYFLDIYIYLFSRYIYVYFLDMCTYTLDLGLMPLTWPRAPRNIDPALKRVLRKIVLIHPRLPQIFFMGVSRAQSTEQ